MNGKQLRWMDSLCLQRVASGNETLIQAILRM